MEKFTDSEGKTPVQAVITSLLRGGDQEEQEDQENQEEENTFCSLVLLSVLEGFGCRMSDSSLCVSSPESVVAVITPSVVLLHLVPFGLFLLLYLHEVFGTLCSRMGGWMGEWMDGRVGG